MHATIRRYEGVDPARTNEVVGKVNETLLPQLRNLPGFAGYFLIEAGNGVISSLGLFETAEQANASSKLVGKWIDDEQLATAIPTAPSHESLRLSKENAASWRFLGGTFNEPSSLCKLEGSNHCLGAMLPPSGVVCRLQ